ncbi:MAG: thymidylate synthase [Candidatus Pacearchaeota archaeon]|jgi:thymidylate synthase
MVQQFLEHSKKILTSERSNFKWGSKGSGLISLFGYQNEYDLREGYPLATTKKMFTKSMIHETLWFIRGNTNIKYLEDNGCKIWRGNAFEYNLPAMVKESIFPRNLLEKSVKYSSDWDKSMLEYAQKIKESSEFAERFGDAGPIYPAQWRHWKHFDEKQGKIVEIDQLRNMIEGLKKKPTGKKHIVTAWNPGDVPNMSLPPCHVLFQATINEENELELNLYQRSSDMFLGVQFNYASYSLITQLIAQEVGAIPKTFIHSFGDTHFYTGLENKSNWYKEHFHEFRERVRKVKSREGYLEILDWVNKNAPRDANQTEENYEPSKDYDHITAILEQLSREPRPLPKLIIAKKPFDKLNIDDFIIEDYNPYPKIERAMAI